MKFVGLFIVLISSLSAYELEDNVKNLEKHLFTYYKMMDLYKDMDEYHQSIRRCKHAIKEAEKVLDAFETSKGGFNG